MLQETEAKTTKESYTAKFLPEIKSKGKARAKKLGKTFNVYLEDLVRKDLKENN